MEMLAVYERFRLLFTEHEDEFREWQEGLQIINLGVGAFVNHVEEFVNNPEQFRLRLLAATTKWKF
jgi:hypothetical protein